MSDALDHMDAGWIKVKVQMLCAGILEIRATFDSIFLSQWARHDCLHRLWSSQVHPALQYHSGQGMCAVNDGAFRFESIQFDTLNRVIWIISVSQKLDHHCIQSQLVVVCMQSLQLWLSVHSVCQRHAFSIISQISQNCHLTDYRADTSTSVRQKYHHSHLL